MTLQFWIIFVITESLSPGPAVLFVISYGLTQGGRASLWATAGILTTNALYFVLSALGMGAVLLASEKSFTILKYSGACYLIYLGVQTLRGSGLAVRSGIAAAPVRTGWRALLRGITLQMANPKAIIFFVALLPQFVDPQRPLIPQIELLGITSLIVEFGVLAGYGYLAGRASTLVHSEKFALIVSRASGIMLVAAGAGLALAGTAG